MKPPRAKAFAKPKARKPVAKRSATPPARKPGSVMTGAPVPVFAWPPDEDRVEEIFARLSRVMPEPCSMESTPASSRSSTVLVAKVWTATRPPAS